MTSQNQTNPQNACLQIGVLALGSHSPTPPPQRTHQSPLLNPLHTHSPILFSLAIFDSVQPPHPHSFGPFWPSRIALLTPTRIFTTPVSVESDHIRPSLVHFYGQPCFPRKKKQQPTFWSGTKKGGLLNVVAKIGPSKGQ